MLRRSLARTAQGFTLVELVMVIALAGVVAVMVGVALSRPMEGYLAQGRRTELVDLASGALGRLARDVRLAVPNSLRVSSDGRGLELMLTHVAGRYRPNRAGSQTLRFAGDGTCSDSLPADDCNAFFLLEPNADINGGGWLVLNNVGAESNGVPEPGRNVWAYEPGGVITPDGVGFSSVADAGTAETRVTLTNLPAGGFGFEQPSPAWRVYYAREVVGYRCKGDRIWRYTTDQRSAGLPSSDDNSLPAGAVPLVASVATCDQLFGYQPGSTQRAALLRIRLRLSEAGESLELLQQVHVDNAP